MALTVGSLRRHNLSESEVDRTRRGSRENRAKERHREVGGERLPKTRRVAEKGVGLTSYPYSKYEPAAVAVHGRALYMK